MWCTLVVFGTVLASSLAEFPVPRSTIAQPRADSTDYRLPTHTLPVHYDVTLEPFFDTFTFDGRVLIEVDVTEEANNITLHANTLTIDEGNVSITASPDVSVAVANISYDSDKHFVIVYANFSVGTYYLDIPFTGILNSDNSGFYRASYTDEDGNTRWLATTQFEATSARKAFPCFDEPALKAQFTISLVREEAYNSISNMKLNSTQDLGDGRFQDTFERSITMPTYLVAFIVSDFEYVESYQYNRSEAVYARSQMIQDGRGIYPLNISIQILKAMEDYTAIDYHIDKMYQAAIPDSWFAAGAMENWGLVTYRERYLLYKEGVTTSSEKQTITAIISHEYGHQWFGNLVSPSWWIYIWLNEGFATYFEYYATEVVEPSWRMMEQMVIKTLQYAMESDALESTRAMSTDAGSPSEISALFDRVAYDKSGSVIRMMEHFLTTPVFQSGLNKYLIDRSYSYAVPSDLWRGLQEALDESSVTLPDGETVESIMETWNSQAGFPVVYVERNYENGSATFTQSRFLLNNATHELDQIWSIPINYASADDLDFSNTTATHWLTQESSTWDLSLNPESWIIVNKQEGGYYRVNYDATNWALIANYLKSENYGNVHVVNRAQLVDDAFNLARSGRISYTVLLNLAEYISQETDYVPLYSLFRGLTYLNRYLSGTEYYSKFKGKMMLVKFLLSLLLAHYSSASPFSLPVTSRLSRASNSSEYLLPTHIVPVHYIIELEPDFENEVFNGSVTIEFKVTQNSTNVTLHARELDIQNNTISLTFGDEVYAVIESAEYSEDDKNFLVLEFNKTLEVSDEIYILTIGQFTGILNLDNAGFYLAKYTDENGVEQRFGTTQFESTSARRAFPCLDEPALKANFTLGIIRGEDYSTISNTPISTTEPVTEGRYRDVFPTTVKMSTYLLAFIVSKLKSVADSDGFHQVFARSTEIDAGKGEFALEAGGKILDAIAEFVSTPYTLEKMDQAAIPNNYFAAGAMENWGLVTYREVYLLYSNQTSLLSQKQTIATIVSHEFGHQWFGNLVSPQWWKYIWLNEGFATYFEYYGASIAEPEWELMEQFVTRNLQYAMAADGLESTRPMNFDAGSPSDISALFDTVAYEKAGSVIRMAETFLTTPVFRNGLSKYLAAKGFDAAEPEDLYKALQEAVDEEDNSNLLPSGLTVSDILSNWDSLAGYPVINVKVDFDTKQVTFKQERFLLKSDTSTLETPWIVPINYATATSHNFSDTSTDYWLTSEEGEVTIENLTEGDWIIVNKQERGYYRVNYEEALWNYIIDYLNSDMYSHIHKLNRAQLIDDSFNLARSGRLSYEIPLNLSKYLVRERDYLPFYSFFSALTFLNTELAGSEYYNRFQQYVLDLLSEVHEYLGVEESSTNTHTENLNRMNVLNWLCKYGNEHCRTGASESFKNWKDNGQVITPNLQASFFCGAMVSATQEDWDFLYSQYESATEDSLRSRIITGLGCSEDTAILKNYLNKITDESSSLNSSHRTTAYASVYNSGNIGLKYALEYLEENYKELNESTSLNTIISGISSKISTKELLSEIEEFVASVGISDSLLSSAKENVDWYDKHSGVIENWLQQNSNETETTPSPGGGTTPSPGGETTPSPGGETTPSPGGETTPSPGGETTPSPGGETTTDGGETTPGSATYVQASIALFVFSLLLNIVFTSQ